MSLYIIIAIIAYSLYAFNGIVDKFLLTKAVRSPAVYAFFIGITGPFTLVLAPWAKWLSFSDILVALAGGAAFVWALFFLYKATQQTSISRILPIEGGLVPVFTLFFAYIILGERLLPLQLGAFIFLVLGAVLISFRHDKTGWHSRAFTNATIAAILFALSFVLIKYIFDNYNFASGLVWTRLGFFVVALSFLIPKSVRKAVFNAPKSTTAGNKYLYLSARVSGSVAGILQNYAISLGSVTIVNAMQGTQYALLLIGTLILSNYFPKILKEKISRGILTQKIVAILLISAGLVMLSL
ncbi:MAG TPA: EamA family transporter [Candidatus Doudnabacteria bacterium]|nr:EamA family transporter [Candidatus Doudnabacteria bacterium]